MAVEILLSIGAMNMISNRNWLAGSLLAGAALITAGAGVSLAAVDDAASSAPVAQGPHGWHHHGQGHLLSKLNLSAEQQGQIKNIMTSAGPQMKSIHQQMHANSLRLSQTQPTDANYSNVVAEVSQANATLHSQMTTQRAEVRASVFKVLTPAQQTQLATLEAQMQNRPHGGFGPRGAGAPPAAQ
jgi:periplasmic protein CpxP/Spy